MRTRICTGCGVEKPLTDFYRCHTMPLGREYSCKACRNPRLVENTRRWRHSARVGSDQRLVAAAKKRQQISIPKSKLEYAIIDGERVVKWWK